MITSSMSVKFCTNTTRWPRNSRYRRATSKAMYDLACPRWLKSYVVGPQTYIFTTPGVRGANGSFRRVRVLYNRSVMTDANAATGTALLRPWPANDGSSYSLARGPASRRNLYAAPRCARRRGPIDQRKIAAFARRKPWVQIPLGPLYLQKMSTIRHGPSNREVDRPSRRNEVSSRYDGGSELRLRTSLSI